MVPFRPTTTKSPFPYATEDSDTFEFDFRFSQISPLSEERIVPDCPTAKNCPLPKVMI